MRLQQYLVEFIDIDKSLSGIQKPNNITWVFDIGNEKFRVYVVSLSSEYNQKWYEGLEIILERWDSNKWSVDYSKSKVNGGILGGKIVSIVFDMINRHKPKVFTMRSYTYNLTKLYDTIWLKYHKSSPFNQYTKYKKDISGTTIYSFVKGVDIQEDNYMFDNYMDMI